MLKLKNNSCLISYTFGHIIYEISYLRYLIIGKK